MILLKKKEKGFTLVELMVVIVIVGILAAVAIPKFMDASHKAKASEFPTQLTSIYTGQQAYSAENGSFAADLSTLKSLSGVDIQSTSKWFNYATTSADASHFQGTATVVSAFGITASGDQAWVKEDNSKSACANLAKYCPSWK